MVTNDGKPRGYAFIEYEKERDMHSEFKVKLSNILGCGRTGYVFNCFLRVISKSSISL